ncbi:MAG: HNH endonuclease [Chloroflexi bacterium]|nr:HNH endonuclease [Chloroflexota bacterium]
MQARQESHYLYGGILGTAGSWGLIGGLLWIAGLLTAVYGPNLPGYVLIGLSVVAFMTEILLGKFYYPQKHKVVNKETESRLIELAEQRQESIDERDAFYGSSEWRAIRIEIIREQGSVCRACRRGISNEVDVTVDHIRPRSIYPKLALVKSNLRVLCRACNSAKGASDI